jgi:hypothetical protein
MEVINFETAKFPKEIYIKLKLKLFFNIQENYY